MRSIRQILAVAAILASCLGVYLAAYRQDYILLETVVRMQKHAGTPPNKVVAPAPVRCRRMLRVINVRDDDVLNLRADPSHNALIRTGIPPNARGLIDLQERSGAWRRVGFKTQGEHIVGFVNGAFVADDGILCFRVEDMVLPMPIFYADRT